MSLRTGESDRVVLGATQSTRAEHPLGLRLRARADSLPRWWPVLLLGGLLLGGGALLAYETRGTIFWADEWQWILDRRGGGLDSFLQPHNQHLSLIPVALYKLLFATVGLRHYWPYRALLLAAELVCAGLIFTYARQRVGSFYALLASALILLFGPGWQDILWPFQTAWILTVLAGVGALLALDRRDRAGDVAACVLLGVALASSSPGLAIAVGLAVEVLQRRRWRDLWLVAVPVVLYAFWWLTYQKTLFNWHSLLLTPRFMFNSAAGTVSALTGLAQVNPYNDSGGDFLAWGAPLLLLGLVGIIRRLRLLGRIPSRVFTLSVILLAFWLLTGVGRSYVAVGSIVLTSTGHESRYLYVGAVFMVLLVVELARGRGSDQPALAATIAVLTAAAIISNLGSLNAGARLLRDQAQYTEAELETMNLSRNLVSPGYVSNGFIFGIVTSGAWFAAERALGSPALSALQLTRQPDFARQAADSQLLKIQAVALPGASGSPPAAANPPPVDAIRAGTESAAQGCVRFRATRYSPLGSLNSVEVTVPTAGLLVRAGTGTLTLGLRRFSTQFAQLGTVSPGADVTLKLRPDQAPQPWHAQIIDPGTATVCSLEAR